MPNAARAAAFLILLSFGCRSAPVVDLPKARDGVLDLSQWDFETKPAVPLEGAWVFRYGELLGPSLLTSDAAPAPPFIDIPTSWNRVTDPKGGKLDGIGFATHALRVLLPTGTHDLALEFGDAYSAELLYVNGIETVERGIVGATRKDEVPGMQGRVAATGNVRGVMDLVLQISNHVHHEGGPVRAPRLGLRKPLQEQADTTGRIDFLILGCLLVLGLFYAAMSMGRPDKEISLFALMTLLLALRTATTRWYIIDVLPVASLGQLRLDYISFILLPLVFCHLMGELFPGAVPGWLLRLTYAYGSLALIGPIFLKPWVFTAFRDGQVIVGAAFGAVAVLSVARAALLGRTSATPLLLCSVFVLAVGFRDAAVGMRLLPYGRDLLPMATAILVFTHAVVLGRRVTEALHSTRQLAVSLRESNESLEQRIFERTQELERVAMTDPLTNLWNRRSLLKLAEAERARTGRSGERLGVMMIDCDNFKLINDVHGHDAGDEVLRSLSRRFTVLMRTQDLVGRWGGEEFLMIFATADTNGALAAAERVRKDVADLPFDVSASVSLQVTVSIGVALLRDASEPIEDVIRRADESLYIAKESGKNCVIFYGG